MSQEMTQLEKLQQLKKQQKKKSNNMTQFSDLVAVNVGVEQTPYYPKLKDEEGNKIKDDDGNDLRSKDVAGYTHTFTEFGTAKVIKVVLPKSYKLNLLKAYKISGKGYDIRQANLIFLEQDGAIANY